jgi:hypothetical protein
VGVGAAGLLRADSPANGLITQGGCLVKGGEGRRNVMRGIIKTILITAFRVFVIAGALLMYALSIPGMHG